MEAPTFQTTPNSTEAGSSSFHMAYGAVLAAAIMEIIIFFLGTIGNLFTIVAVLHSKDLQYATNYLIVSLAVADLLVSTILVPMRASQHIAYQYDHTIPKSFVEVAGFVGRVNIIASISTLVCLSVDRYIALSRPLRYATSIRYNLRKVLVVIATVWIVSAVITSMPKFPGVTDTPFLIFFVVFVLVSTLVICVMYYHIFKIVSMSVRSKTPGKAIRYSNNFQKPPSCNKNRVADNSKSVTSTVNASTESVTGSIEDRAAPSETRRPQFSREERKAAKTIGFVITAFILLVYPRIIIILYHFGNEDTSDSKIARFWMRVLLYSNSAVNPFFYAYRHKGFRTEFRKMGLRCLGLGAFIRQRYVTIRRTDQSQSSSTTFYA